MSIETRKVPDHLNYFLCIEEDIGIVSRWIEISEANFHCYSIELARLLMTTSAEADVVAKLICKEISPRSRARGIYSYQEILTDAFPKITNSCVVAARYGIELTPWSNWSEPKNPPEWWKANNKVKHHRSEHFNQATLKNLLNSVAGLLILVLLYYGPKLGTVRPAPRLFEPFTYGYIRDNGLVFDQNSG